MTPDISTLYTTQLKEWKTAADNYAALQNVITKDLGNGARVQCNPARITSTGAKMDAATLGKRPCFLCHKNRPLQQSEIQWGDYEILVNPYPIFDRHYTIPLRKHADQRIYGRIADMAALARLMEGYTVFYNGPRCGASAPDHMHFQAGESAYLPIWQQVEATEAGTITSAEVFGGMGIIVISAESPEQMQELFNKVYRHLPLGQEEPMLNLLMRATGDTLTAIVIPRKQHRPTFYGDGPGQMLLSPASVDLGGVFITPRKEDFERIDRDIIRQVYRELCLTADEVADICRKSNEYQGPVVNVGIMADDKLEFVLHGNYMLDGEPVTGIVSLTAHSVKEPLLFTPVDEEAYVELKDVTIGINFHWERKENQCFKGAVKVMRDGDDIVFINIIDVEDYLTSVISSEMSATSSLELLKAHAVISRSWVLAQIVGKKDDKAPAPRHHDPDTIIKWYDHDDHDIFDVCADDHCQRYQGITRQTTKTVSEAVNATRGEVLMSGDELCDARFYKCCGGMMEEFQYCWADDPKPYLRGIRDDAAEESTPDLTIEANAREWILSSPEAFCNTTEQRVLSQVLNGYDQETVDFYRWRVEYDHEYLTDLILRRSGIDFGRIIDMIPLERGKSGRISLLKIVGEKTTKTIGKELEIRRILSESHLYSSAFVAEKTDKGFILHGAGWGHGVGLCQIGAAMMADKGYDYRSILEHYYPGSQITQFKQPEK